MDILLEKYIFDCEKAYYYIDGKKYKQSVHGKSYVRFNEAKKQAELPPVKKSEIKEYVLDFLRKVGIKTTSNPELSLNSIDDIDYKNIAEEYSLSSEKDLIWIKFTKDGYVSVVATSNDINFDIPKDEKDYDSKIRVLNPYTQKYEEEWKHKSSGILIHKLNKEWDESFVLLFPLSNIPNGYNRHDIEKAIGNYIITEKNVPVLDLFSHLY